jgi:hypothetical protein
MFIFFPPLQSHESSAAQLSSSHIQGKFALLLRIAKAAKT